jgi:hypothetical protein
MTNKQTAVEWLSQELDEFLFLCDNDWKELNTIIQQAKEIEQGQIMDAYTSKCNYKSCNGNKKKCNCSICYYNETYKNTDK